MDRPTPCLPVLMLILFLFFTCKEGETGSREQPEMFALADSNLVVLEFSFDVNQAVYRQTNFGEPPQLAIWIEGPASQVIRTVWVSQRAAKSDWRGKIECPVALPYWESRIEPDFNRRQTPGGQAAQFDAVSGATPKAGRFSAEISVPAESTWNYFIEVNTSADYNKTFAYWSEDGLPDSQANGQPSLVYAGRIIADGLCRDVPVLLGRTAQRRAVSSLCTDLSGITSANRLIENILAQSK